MEVKDRTLKESGSCPQIGKQHQQSFKVEIAASHRSSTYLSQENSTENRKMNRLNRAKRVCHNPLQRGQYNQQPPPPDLIVRGKPLLQNLCRPCGDGLEYNPMCYIPTLSEAKAKNTNGPSLPSAYSENGIEKRHIDVIVRIRPKNRTEEMCKTIVWKTSESTLIFDPREKDTDFFYKGKRQVLRNDFGKKRPNKNLAFEFDSVYGHESTNEEIFEITLKGLISKVLAGFNCTVFAYGATGSGKTYTMLGSTETPGLTILMAEELFRRLNDMESEEFTHDIKVSYLEVYNETIKDLFNPHKELAIREDGKQGLRIPQLTVHKPEGPQELLRLLRNGNGNRSQHATDFNAESSRSHAVFEITVLMHQHSPTERFKKRTATSRLFMVDLAGSEKGSVNIVDGMRQREGANINKSLLALSSCINALADGKTHIPYRNSKLTRLLKDSLSGNCVTVMIANISCAENTFEDTHNTLHYASRAKNIKVTCKQNAFCEERIESNSRISDLKNEVRMLEAELAEERRKHQTTRELLECQVGDGDGFCDASRKNNSHSQHQHKRKQVAKSTPEIHDPVAVNRFMDLLKQKTELVTDLTETSVKCRIHEWQMNWKKLCVDIAEMVGRPKTSDTEHFISITKLMNNHSDLEVHHPDLTDAADELQKSLKNINYEIENVHKTCLKSVEPDAPFVTVSFEEFIRSKYDRMELETIEKLLKFHQQLECTVFRNLKNSQLHRFHLLKFMQRLVISIKEKDGSLSRETEKKFHALLKPVYDPCSELESPPPEKRIDLKKDLEDLANTLQRPVVTFPSNEHITASGLRLPAIQISSQLLPTTAEPSSSVMRINDTSAKDTSCFSFEGEKMVSMMRTHKHGNNSSSINEGTFRAGDGSKKRHCPGILLSQLKQDNENDCEDEESILEIPVSPSSTNDEDIQFLNIEISEEEAEQMRIAAGPNRQSKKSVKRCEKPMSKRDNQRENNKAPPLPLSVPVPHQIFKPSAYNAAIKQRGKDTRSKSNTETPFLLHRGKAMTDFIEDSSKRSAGIYGKQNINPRCIPAIGGGDRCQGQDKIGIKKQQTSSNHGRIPILIKKPLDSVRPFTFCYEETTSNSSFDSSFG